ncbi:hypothetical protein BHE74_00010120 [Ensete ventricosum]|nr:hypothetical protein GW17_00038168 [Ensete ventricosum]RWW81463.1 hypothetical protein BHE74_00010120 [Ensete ventricosum]RZR89218.1 hypothetical protein BHM03_00016894 [Ensete ventricosum]
MSPRLTNVLEDPADYGGWFWVPVEDKEAGAKVSEAGVKIEEAIEEKAYAIETSAGRTKGEGRGVWMKVTGIEDEHWEDVTGSPASVVQRGVVVDPQPLPEPNHGVRLHVKRCHQRPKKEDEGDRSYDEVSALPAPINGEDQVGHSWKHR